MITLEVMGIRMTAGDDTPVLLLQEHGGSRLLPIWIASVDAAAIAIVLEDHEELGRPLTHDLVADLVRRIAGDGVEGAVVINEMSDGVFKAVLEWGEEKLDVRPSDGIAVALRLGWPIGCTDDLMAQVGVESEESGGDEVERFREFLESVNPDDFESGTD